jgi:hypothetical protein
MADARSLTIRDSSGAPVTTGVTLAVYVDTTGTARTPPAITHVGAGKWVFTPSDADETVGTVALVDCGVGALPRRASFAIHLADNSNQFWCFQFEDGAGALWAGAAPSSLQYVDPTGAARTPPSLVAVAGAYLYSLTPSGADVTAGIEGRLDAPAGAVPTYWEFSSEPVVESSGSSGTLAPSVGIQPESLAASALRDYLLRWLPAKATQLNALRGAVVKSAAVGPFVISSGALVLASAREGATTSVTLPTGTVTASAIATAINTAAVPGVTASADGEGRLVLTGDAPAEGVLSCVAVRSSAANTLFGWPAEGCYDVVPAITAPTFKGVMDGGPATVPDFGRTFAIVIGDRSAVEVGGSRADMHNVTLDVSVWVADRASGGHRTRETLQACVRAVRELLDSDDGRTLGRGTVGDILRVQTAAKMKGTPFQVFDAQKVLVATGEVASLTVTVKTFHRPSLTP